MKDIDVRKINTAKDLALALALESETFQQCGFVSMDAYASYLPQSHFYGAFDGDNQCVGMARVIEGLPVAPPLLAHGLEIDRVPDVWVSLAGEGKLEELATLVVTPNLRKAPLVMDLIRLAYRDSKSRGGTHFGIIMEPERVEQLNRHWQLRFFPIGPPQNYMGEVHFTVPFVTEFDDWDANTLRCNPEYFKWFASGPIHDSRYRPHSRPQPPMADLPAPVWAELGSKV